MEDFKRDFPSKEDVSPCNCKEKILIVQNDIDHYNRQIAKIDNDIKILTNKKASLAIKISKKTKYKSILLSELYIKKQ